MRMIAEAVGIDKLITYCPLPGARSTSVPNKAINALIGAIYIDSESDTVAFDSLDRMGWFRYPIRQAKCWAVFVVVTL
jgi:hypothetical protein